jgi:hypothetical protein
MKRIFFILSPLILIQDVAVFAVADAHVHIHICGKVAKSLNAAVKNLKKSCDDASEKTAKAVNNAGEKVGNAVTTCAYVALVGVSVVVFSRLTKGCCNMYHEHCLEKAKQALFDAVNKKSGCKIGIWGFPEGCEKEIKALLCLQGGQEELAKMQQLLKGLFSEKTKKEL